MSTATTPEAPDVGHGDDAKRVLLILDVQHNMLAPPPAGIPAGASVGPNIATILAHARAAVPPPRIVHVRNAGDAGEPDEPGTRGFELVNAPLPGEYVVDKRKNNAFVGTDLGKIIPPTAEIIMVGMQSDFCIRATCSAAECPRPRRAAGEAPEAAHGADRRAVASAGPGRRVSRLRAIVHRRPTYAYLGNVDVMLANMV